MSLITEFYLAVAVGLILSILMEEFLGVSSGGVVAAGYLAMICDDLISMTVVLLVALLTYLVVELVLSRFLLLFGKRKFVACLLVSLIFKVAADLLVPTLPFATLAFRGIGVISPGLIANTSARQGLHITIPAVLAATYATFGIVRLLMLLF